MLKCAYEGLNARPKVYLSKEYFCEMYPTFVSSKLCEFIVIETKLIWGYPPPFGKPSKREVTKLWTFSGLREVGKVSIAL